MRFSTHPQVWRSLSMLSLATFSFVLLTQGLTHLRGCPPTQPATDLYSDISRNSSDKANQLSLLAYNLQLRPRLLFASAQSIRAQALAPLLKGYDALVFAEAFDDYALDDLKAALQADYPCPEGQSCVSSPMGQNQGFSQDSGLVIVSKWPIEPGSQHQKLFEGACLGKSCFNRRGVMMVGINKRGQRYHLLTAQLQAGANAQAQKIRREQIRQIKQFLEVIQIPAQEPIIFAASLPIAPETQPQEYQQMLAELGLTQVQQPDKPSVDPTHNSLVQAESSSAPDVLLTFAQNRQPQTAALAIRPLRTALEQGWRSAPWMYWQCPQQNLSDHHAIEGQFDFSNVQ
ncbi:sphingomyelin phosphodiesterase [Acaryochloris marina NIES-2412]|uniref:sphingomyelin phosphodiesterase n=1 Tax=Acaryochloris marina TaxID=155978 RepID=UPI004058C01C